MHSAQSQCTFPRQSNRDLQLLFPHPVSCGILMLRTLFSFHVEELLQKLQELKDAVNTGKDSL